MKAILVNDDRVCALLGGGGYGEYVAACKMPLINKYNQGRLAFLHRYNCLATSKETLYTIKKCMEEPCTEKYMAHCRQTNFTY